jgi:hypothetical protein
MRSMLLSIAVWSFFEQDCPENDCREVLGRGRRTKYPSRRAAQLLLGHSRPLSKSRTVANRTRTVSLSRPMNPTGQADNRLQRSGISSSTTTFSVPEGLEGLDMTLADSVAQGDLSNISEEEVESCSSDRGGHVTRASELQLLDTVFESIMDDVDAYSQVVTDNTDRTYRGLV